MNLEEDHKYSYVTKPRAVQTNRLKDRDGSSRSARIPAPNIMHDPRIIRGSMFASQSLAVSATKRDTKDKVKRRKGSIGKKKSNNIYEAQKLSSYSFTPFSLEANLVEQLPVVPEREAFSQTDAILTRERPRKPGANQDGQFLRLKAGVDSSTQIEASDKLFNFDIEVKPLLNVLVSKTIAQALAEVKEEQEMLKLQHERSILLAHKEELAKADRELEAKALEAQRQKEQTKRENELKRQRKQAMTEKLIAWQLAHQLVPLAITQATKTLEEEGVFFNPLHQDIKQWLGSEVYEDADAKVRLRMLSSALLDDLIDNGLRRYVILSHLLPNEDEAMVRISLRDPLLLSLESGTDANLQVIGPMLISRRDGLATIEQKIQSWVNDHVGSEVQVPVGGYLSILNLSEII